MPIKLSIAASITLYKLIIRILMDDNGEERNLPFNLKYKLTNSKDLLEKDVYTYEVNRLELVKKYGVEEESGNIRVLEENIESFKESLKEILNQEVTHTFKKISPADVETITLDGVSSEEISLFSVCLVDDPEYIEDLKAPIPTLNNIGEVEENSTKN